MTKSKLKLPKVIFETDPIWTVNYLCYLARQVNGFFYVRNAYLVLPFNLPFKNSVNFPDLPYTKKFWREIVKVSSIFGKRPLGVANKYPKTLLDEAQKVISPLETKIFPKPALKTTVENLLQKMTQTNLFKKELQKIKEIRILITNFGTSSSFSYRQEQKGLVLLITIREDFPKEILGRSIISTLLMIQENKLMGNVFEERKIITDFLIENFFPDLNLEIGSTNSEKLKLESKKYLLKLGRQTKNPFSQTIRGLLINGKSADKHLTNQENLLLRLFIKNDDKVTTYDEIAQTIWETKADEKFSLWAITKLKEKLVKKIERLGVKNLIQTQRGTGYYLNYN